MIKLAVKLFKSLVALYWKLTSGRPMTFVDFAFTDKVSGKPVNYYRDFYGRPWLANDPWDMDRVEIKRIPFH